MFQTLLSLVITLVITSLAQADASYSSDKILPAPVYYCGQVEIVQDDMVSIEAVVLSLTGKTSGSYFLVHTFVIGQQNTLISGRLSDANTLQFNYNNDYIPGDNATYNTDIELVFNDAGATGTIKKRIYPDADGNGGYGDTKGNLVATGRFNLKNCYSKK